MLSLPEPKTLYTFLSGKLLEIVKIFIDIITIAVTVTLYLSETIYHRKVKSFGTAPSLISVDQTHKCDRMQILNWSLKR